MRLNEEKNLIAWKEKEAESRPISAYRQKSDVDFQNIQKVYQK